MVGHPAGVCRCCLAPLQVYSSTQQPATKSWAKVLHERLLMAAIYIDDERSIISKQKPLYSSPLSVWFPDLCLYPINLRLIIGDPIYYMGCCPWSIGHFFYYFTTRQTFVYFPNKTPGHVQRWWRNGQRTVSCCTAPTSYIYPVFVSIKLKRKGYTKKKISNVIDTHLAKSIVLRPNEMARVGQFADTQQMNWRVEDSSNGCCRSRGLMASPTGPEFEPQWSSRRRWCHFDWPLNQNKKSQLWFDHDTINWWRSAETWACKKWRGRYQRVVHGIRGIGTRFNH